MVKNHFAPLNTVQPSLYSSFLCGDDNVTQYYNDFRIKCIYTDNLLA